jgi:hypothetical protein
MQLYLAEDLAFSEENQKWIRGEIQAAIHPNGFKKVADHLRYWGFLGVLVTAFIALIGVAVGLGIAVANLINQNSEFRGKTDQRLTTIEGDLKDIKAQLVRMNLTGKAALPTKNFKAFLGDVRSSITSAQKQGVKVPAQAIEEIAHKMAEIDKSTPEFWPTAAAVISYQSSLLVGDSRNWSVTFPRCQGTVDLDASPHASVQGKTPEGKLLGPPIPIERIGNQDCYVELDGKSISRWDCTRCLVKYAGGQLKMRDVNFKDCLFIFDFGAKQVPAPDGRRLSEMLLASGASDVKIPAG